MQANSLMQNWAMLKEKYGVGGGGDDDDDEDSEDDETEEVDHDA